MVAKLGAVLLAAAAVANAQILDPIRPLGAGSKRAINNFAMDHELDMEYAEMETYNDPNADTFGATVHISTIDPAVQTEDFEHLVTDITCTDDKVMKVTFASEADANDAKSQWTAPSMTIITLTSTCNENNIRVPWTVSTPVFEGNVATMDGKPSDWDTVSNGLKVDFGSRGNMTNPDHNARRSILSKRADLNLGFDFQNKAIYPPEVFNKLPVPVPVGGSGSVTTTCVKCTGKGKAVFSAGSFDIKSAVKDAAKAAADKVKDTAEDVKDKAEDAAKKAAEEAKKKAEEAKNKILGIFGKRDDPWKDIAGKLNVGTLKMDLQDLGGHFEFQTDVMTNKEFVVPMLGNGVTLSPIQIQNILSVGPNINPQLAFKFESDEDLSFNYGFEYSVPSGAGFELNMLDPGKSKANKLDGIKVSALPFKTNTKEVAAKGLKYNIAFRPIISVGAKILDQTINPIELILDVPKVTGDVSFVENVDKTCKGEGDQDAFKAKASFGFGLAAGANINIGGFGTSPQFKIASKDGLFPKDMCFPVKKSSKKPTEDPQDSEEQGDDSEEPATTTTTKKAKKPVKTPVASSTVSAGAQKTGAVKSKTKTSSASAAPTKTKAAATAQDKVAAATPVTTPAPAAGGDDAATIAEKQKEGLYVGYNRRHARAFA